MAKIRDTIKNNKDKTDIINYKEVFMTARRLSDFECMEIFDELVLSYKLEKDKLPQLYLSNELKLYKTKDQEIIKDYANYLKKNINKLDLENDYSKIKYTPEGKVNIFKFFVENFMNNEIKKLSKDLNLFTYKNPRNEEIDKIYHFLKGFDRSINVINEFYEQSSRDLAHNIIYTRIKNNLSSLRKKPIWGLRTTNKEFYNLGKDFKNENIINITNDFLNTYGGKIEAHNKIHLFTIISDTAFGNWYKLGNSKKNAIKEFVDVVDDLTRNSNFMKMYMVYNSLSNNHKLLSTLYEKILNNNQNKIKIDIKVKPKIGPRDYYLNLQCELKPDFKIILYQILDKIKGSLYTKNGVKAIIDDLLPKLITKVNEELSK